MKRWVLAASLGWIMLGSTPGFAQDKFNYYTVQPGDTCTSIAKKFYGDMREYEHIHQFNDLSEQMFACRPGTKLRLPILPEPPEAEVTARAGKVNARPPSADWSAVDVGSELYKAWRVNTLERARAELGFFDNSTIQLTENTLVVIYGRQDTTTHRVVSRRATVEEGRLKAHLAELSGTPLQVDTPQAEATFHTGKGQVTVEKKESRVANHSGKPVEVRSSATKAQVSVRAGFGTRVQTGKSPEKPRPLPQTPQWASTFTPASLTLPAENPVIRAGWEPVSGAAGYVVEVTRTPLQLDVLFVKQVPANITSLEIQGLPAGNYYVSIVALDADKFESVAAPLKKLQVMQLSVSPTQLLGDGAVLLGATLVAPQDVECTLNDSEYARSVVADTPGEHRVRCRAGELAVETPIRVVQPTVRRIDARAEDALAVPVGGTRTLAVQFDPGLPPGVAVRTSGGVGVAANRVNQTDVDLALHAPVGARPQLERVGLYYHDLPLAAFDIQVTPGRTALGVRAVESNTSELLVSALVGYDAVGVAPYWGADFPAAGATLEVGAALVATTVFAGELRAGLGLHVGDTAEQVVSLGAQLMLGRFDLDLAPYLGLGIGWHAALGRSHHYAPHLALGVMPEIGDAVRLRAEVGADLLPDSGELRVLPQVRVGVAWQF